jgi:hypothetical protein
MCNLVVLGAFAVARVARLKMLGTGMGDIEKILNHGSQILKKKLINPTLNHEDFLHLVQKLSRLPEPNNSK